MAQVIRAAAYSTCPRKPGKSKRLCSSSHRHCLLSSCSHAKDPVLIVIANARIRMSEKPERREGIKVSFRVTRRALGVFALCALILAIVSVPIIIELQAKAREGATLANMHTIQFAAEEYGLQYYGHYSRTAAGLVPVLSRAGKLWNPFTNKWSEPREPVLNSV